ncbi:MAG: alginate lyase family protein [Verrucomicrobiota bacterium]
MWRALLLALPGFFVGCSSDKEVAERPSNAEEALLLEIAERLDPETPGLQEFFQQITQEDFETAQNTLLTYFRAKEIPIWALPDPLPVEQQTLINALAAWRGRFSFQGVEGDALLEDGTIDWENRGPRGDPEWTWFLHRHFFLREMMVLYQAQGHDEFVAQLNDYLLDWFWKFPPPDKQSFSASWRALEAARRYVDSWLPVYAELRNHPAFSEEAELAVIAGAARHANYLKNFHHFGGNHLVTEMMSLAAIAAVWPEFNHAEEWMGYAVDRALEEMDLQIYPDGAHKELANHYQWIAGSSFQRLYSILVGSDASDSAEKMKPQMEMLWDYYARVTRPDGTGPLNNDSDLEPNAAQLKLLARYYDRPDWLYIATQEEEGEAPEDPPSKVFPWAGQAILRSDWGPEADWVFFDAGPFGADHQQNDRLHVSASLMGKNLLVDSGRYVYRDDKWSAFFRGPLSHNVPTFGKFERVIPDRIASVPQEDLKIEEIDGLLRVTGEIPLRQVGSSGWEGRHQRTVSLGDGFVWIVDLVELPVSDQVTFRWRFHPDLALVRHPKGWAVKESEETVAIWRMAANVPTGVEELRGVEEGQLQGWYSPEYNERVPNSVLLYESSPSNIAIFSWVLASKQLEAAQPGVSGSEATLSVYKENEAHQFRLDLPVHK